MFLLYSNNLYSQNMNQELFDAIRTNNVDQFNELVTSVDDINIIFGDNNTLLKYAILCNSLEIIKLLLDKGSRICTHHYNYRMSLCSTEMERDPVYSAITWKHLDALKILLDRIGSAHPLKQDIFRFYWSYESTKSKIQDMDIIKTLIDSGCKVPTDNHIIVSNISYIMQEQKNKELQEQLNQMAEEIKRLNARILELEYRPPMSLFETHGGPGYHRAKNSFENMNESRI